MARDPGGRSSFSKALEVLGATAVPGVLAIVSGIVALFAVRGPLGERSSRLPFWVAWATAIAPRVPSLVPGLILGRAYPIRSLIWLGAAAFCLEAGSAAALGGDALLLRIHSPSRALEQRARVAAGLVQVSFLLSFMARIPSLGWVTLFRPSQSGAGGEHRPPHGGLDGCLSGVPVPLRGRIRIPGHRLRHAPIGWGSDPGRRQHADRDRHGRRGSHRPQTEAAA